MHAKTDEIRKFWDLKKKLFSPIIFLRRFVGFLIDMQIVHDI